MPLWEDRMPERHLPADIVEAFRSLSSPLVGDAMDRLSLMRGLTYRGGALPLVGPALTVDLHPGDNLMLHQAIRRAHPGDILVVHTYGETSCGVAGELMVGEARSRKVGGLVVDGAVRDLDALMAQDLPVFSRRLGPMGAWKGAPGRLGWPVACGGVSVSTGDLLIGDRDGLAVVPRTLVESVLQAATERARREEEIKKAMAQGASLYDMLKITWPDDRS